MRTRRDFISGSAVALTATFFSPRAYTLPLDTAPYLAPYRYPELIVKATHTKGAFDERTVDDPIVFRANGRFYMLYIGWDGIGYQTGLADSTDLIEWRRLGCVAPRNPASTYTKFNLALSSILRDKHLHSPGDAIKINGHYLGAWNAYPNPGLEEGAAVIGLAWSEDLLHWQLTDPILLPQDGAAWEHGGLYRPDLLFENAIYYLYYNAKTDKLPQQQGGGWREQSGVATSRDLKTWTRYKGNPVLRNGGVNQPSTPRDSRFASNPYVVRKGSEWAMFYFGLSPNNPACELLALGRDPYHFTKVPQVLLDAGPPGSIDETFAHKPSVIYHDGMLYHFYCAVSGKWPDETRGIGVARSRPW
jgi:predicted GH43/DUF377 family glycosyl hydrolase